MDLAKRLDRPIVLVGLMGAGKSTVGRRLARRLGVPFVDSDAAIEDAAGLSPAEVFERYGEQEFRDGVVKALDYAQALGCKLVHCMAGIPPKEVPWVTAGAIYAANLAWAAERALAAGVKIVIEPINHRDMPGYLLHTQAQGAAIVEAIGRDRLGLQFDVYHVQITEGDITRRMEQFMPVIAHMQIADVPARNEPGTGEIGWGYVFRRMDELGYGGWVGCEYRPAGETGAGLAWRERFGG